MLRSSLREDFTPVQMERLFNSFQVFWQVLFYTFLVLIVFCFVAWFFDAYAKRKYKDKLSMKNKRIIENYNSVDFMYLWRLRKSRKQRKEENKL